MLAELGQAGDGTCSSSLPLNELSELISYHRQTKAGAARLWFQQGAQAITAAD